MDYDVIIIGGGPAGATTAKNLAERGTKTLLIDKRKFPDDKPCGGGLPTRVAKRFPYIKPFLDSISYGSITYSKSLKFKFKIIRKSPLLTTIQRKKFDYELLKIAEKKGAQIKTNTQVLDIIISKKQASIKLDDNTTYTSELIIGADGNRSITTEKTNLRPQNQKICYCLVAEEPMKSDLIEKYYTKNRLVYLFMKTHGIAGYGWIFPKKNHINIGLGEFETALPSSQNRKNLKEIYDHFIKDLKKNKLLPEDFKISNLKGANLPIFPLEKTYADRVLICGDAAGFINPITGEGIYFAMTSGEIAAEVAHDALRHHRYDENYLSIYQKKWMQDFGKDIKLLGRFNRIWGTKSERIVRLLTKDKVFAKLVVGATGGSISASEYKNKLWLRYIYASLKDIIK